MMQNIKEDSDGTVRFHSESKKEIENEKYKLCIVKKEEFYEIDLVSLVDNSQTISIKVSPAFFLQINSLLSEFFSSDDMSLIDLEGFGLFIPKISRYSKIEQTYPISEAHISFFQNKLCVENASVLLYLTKKDELYLMEGFEFTKTSENIIQKSFKFPKPLLRYIYRLGFSIQDTEKIDLEISKYW